ncbi:MAG: type III-B CRISPR module-associated protein Cmr3 [Acidobacteriia bacterium]|nr:type III-B CRISPR module-associated protein Cmr3 [Methyloceanibacter sp.]MCL6490839.1 type III-B CRISPR module-associated protein Cmr3 [Terriglobia bacterium]
MTTILEIICRDPIIARDGRPFGAAGGNRMRSLDWLLPSVLAGSLRTTLGKAAKRDFSADNVKDLLRVEVAGPLPCAARQLYLPAPEDCVVHPEHGPLRARPQPQDEGSGCDWPSPGLLPVGLTQAQASEDFKPAEAPVWWPLDRYAAWLAKEDITFDEHFLGAAEREERTHVKIDPAAGAAEESQLFTTAALALSHLPRYRTDPKAKGTPGGAGAGPERKFVPITLCARIRADGWCGEVMEKLDALHPLGGERRLVHWRARQEADLWHCPENIRNALAKPETRHVRMALATPAIFKDGWKPGWLNASGEGAPPGAEKLTLRLKGVSIARWKAVSGWSLAKLPDQPLGPKPVKRMVPAGGVYFFEVVQGEASVLAERWLKPVSDDAQDRLDGFGLAAWGVW